LFLLLSSVINISWRRRMSQWYYSVSVTVPSGCHEWTNMSYSGTNSKVNNFVVNYNCFLFVSIPIGQHLNQHLHQLHYQHHCMFFICLLLIQVFVVFKNIFLFLCLHLQSHTGSICRMFCILDMFTMYEQIIASDQRLSMV